MFMNEQYVTCKVAKLLKEKGFDWGCCSYWCIFPNGDIVHTDYGHFANHNRNETDRFVSRPTQALSCRWLREVHGIDIIPIIRHSLKYAQESPFRDYACRVYDCDGNIVLSATKWYSRYENAIESALEYVLKNLI